MTPCHHFRSSHIDTIADALIRSVCGAEAEAMIRTKLTKAADGETRPSRISHAAFFSVEFKRLAPYETRWKSMLRSLWADEERIILANLKKLKKGMGRKGLADNIMYPQAPFTKRLSKETRKLLATMLSDIGQQKLDELDLSAAFDVTNPHVAEWLDDYAFKFSKNLEEVGSEKIRAILEDGMAAGKGIPELMHDVREAFDTMSRYRAEMISRTETSRASNKAAMEAYVQSGVVEKKQWLTAPDCCDACKDLDGEVVLLEDDFKSAEFDDTDAPPLHPNCVLPGTLCETPGGLVVGLRAWYRGQAIELSFANGGRLSVTPNHLLLTPNGFAPAYLLREGDDIFYCPEAEGVIPVNPNNDRKPALVEEIVSSLAESGGMKIRRVPLAPEYLHGDGRLCNGDIDVIGPDGLLHDTDEATLTKGLGTSELNFAYGDLVNLSRHGTLALMLRGLADTADRIMGGLRQTHPFFLARLAHANEHRCATPAGSNPAIEQTPTDDASRNMEATCQALLRSAGEVQATDQVVRDAGAAEQIWVTPDGADLDANLYQAPTDGVAINAEPASKMLQGIPGFIKTTQVVDVKFFSYSGHVYDLQTVTSLYICNSIVSSNCRCAVAAAIE